MIFRMVAVTMFALTLAALAPGPMLADDRAKQIAITGIGYLYYKSTGELTDIHFSVSHRLSQPIVAITFAMAFRSSAGTVLKTERFRHPFQWENLGKTEGSPLARDDVYQVQHSMYPHLQGFCT